MHLIDSCKQIFSIQLMVTLLIATCVSLSIQNNLYEKRFYLYIALLILLYMVWDTSFIMLKLVQSIELSC